MPLNLSECNSNSLAASNSSLSSLNSVNFQSVQLDVTTSTDGLEGAACTVFDPMSDETSSKQSDRTQNEEALAVIVTPLNELSFTDSASNTSSHSLPSYSSETWPIRPANPEPPLERNGVFPLLDSVQRTPCYSVSSECSTGAGVSSSVRISVMHNGDSSFNEDAPPTYLMTNSSDSTHGEECPRDVSNTSVAIVSSVPQPPPYPDANDLPPSYDSIFGRVRGSLRRSLRRIRRRVTSQNMAAAHSNNSLNPSQSNDTLHTSSKKKTIKFLLQFLSITVGLHAPAMLLVGGWHYERCENRRQLALFLIVASFLDMSALISIHCRPGATRLSAPLIVFVGIWHFIGTVWAFMPENNCSYFLFVFTCYIVTLSDIILFGLAIYAFYVLCTLPGSFFHDINPEEVVGGSRNGNANRSSSQQSNSHNHRRETNRNIYPFLFPSFQRRASVRHQQRAEMNFLQLTDERNRRRPSNQRSPTCHPRLHHLRSVNR